MGAIYNPKSLGWLDAADYGAVGDGSTDNLSAFNAAFAATATSATKTLFIRKGIYNFSGTLVVPEAITVFGDSSPGDTGGYTPLESAPFEVVLNYTGLSGIAVYCPVIANNIFQNLKIEGDADCGLALAGTFRVNATTAATTSLTCGGIISRPITAGMVVSGQDIPAPVLTNLTTTSGSTTATVSSATGLAVGMNVSGGLNTTNPVPLDTRIATLSGTNVTLSKNATATGTAATTFSTAVTATTGQPVRATGSVASSTTMTVTSGTGIANGMAVTGYGIAVGATISSGGGTTTLTISIAATRTNSGTIYTFSNASQIVTLSNAATGSHANNGVFGLDFTDPLFPGSNFPLYSGTGCEVGYCWVRGFGVDVQTHYDGQMNFHDCLFQNAQTCNARIELSGGFAWDRVQTANDQLVTDAIVAVSAIGSQGTLLDIRSCYFANAQTSIDCDQADINIQGLGLEGSGSVGPAIDIHNGGSVTGGNLHFQIGNYLQGPFRVHGGTLRFDNINGFSNITVSGCSTTSGSKAVTLGSGTVGAGVLVSGTGIVSGTYVASVSGTSVTLSQNASGSGTVSLSFQAAAVQADSASQINVTPSSPTYIYALQTIDVTTLLPTGASAAPLGLAAESISHGALTTDSVTATGIGGLVTTNAANNGLTLKIPGTGGLGLFMQTDGTIGIFGLSVNSSGTITAFNAAMKIVASSGNVIFLNLPTSPAGLASGTIYTNAGIATFAP